MENFDKQIRYFVKIAELHSLSRAAEACGITQSGLSRQLSVLESYLGKSLFHRTGRGVILTSTGERLFQTVSTAYVQIDTELKNVREKEGITEGSIRLAVIHPLSYYFMAETIAEFMAKRPNIGISLSGRSSQDIINLVLSGNSDIGFVYDDALDNQNLRSRFLFFEEMCLVVANERDFPEIIDLQKLNEKFVLFPENYSLRGMIKKAGIDLNVVAESETIDSMLKLVSQGVGICILPSSLPESLLVDYRLKKVAIKYGRLMQRVVMITRSDKSVLPLIEDFIDIALTRAVKISEL